MSTIASLLLGMDPGIKPYNEQEISANRIQSGNIQNTTALLALAEQKRQQEAEALARQRMQQHPESVLGSLGGPPGGGPGGPMTQQTFAPGIPPGVPQQVPGGQDVSRYAGVSPQGGGPIPQSILSQLTPTVTPPPGMSGQGPGQPPPQQNAMLDLLRQNPEAFLAVQKQQLQQQQMQWKLQEQQLDRGVKVSEAIARSLQGVTDQDTLEQARTWLQQVSPQAASRVPQLYNKAAVEQLQQQGVAVSEMAKWQLDMAKARRENVTADMLPSLLGNVESMVPGGGVIPTGPVAAPSGGEAGKMPQRMNNPYNIKLGSRTQHWVEKGLAEPGEPAQDGGRFLKFTDPAIGQQAGRELLQGPGYRDLTVDAALKKWSGGGYGAEIVKDLPGDAKIKDVSAAQMEPLMAAMRSREGWTAPRHAAASAHPDNPRVTQLDTMIRDGEKKALAFALIPGMEGAATQLNNDVNRLKEERNRLEAPAQAYRTEAATQPLKLAQMRAGAEVQLEAKMNEPIGAENAVKMGLDPQTKWKDVPKGTQVLERTPEGAGTKFGEYKASYDGITRVIGMLDNSQATSIVGSLFSGDDATFRRLSGQWLSTVTPEERKFAAAMVAEIASIRHALAGSAVTPQEAEFVKDMMPHTSDPDVGMVRAKLEALQEWVARKHEGLRDQLVQTSVRTPRPLREPQGTVSVPQTPTGSTPSANVDKFKAIKPSR